MCFFSALAILHIVNDLTCVINHVMITITVVETKAHHHHQERTPYWGHSCLHKSAPRVPVLRSMPGREEAKVAWFRISLNSTGPGVSRALAGHPRRLLQSRGGMLMAVRRARQWSVFRLARATWPNKRSLLQRMVSDSGGQPVDDSQFYGVKHTIETMFLYKTSTKFLCGHQDGGLRRTPGWRPKNGNYIFEQHIYMTSRRTKAMRCKNLIPSNGLTKVSITKQTCRNPTEYEIRSSRLNCLYAIYRNR